MEKIRNKYKNTSNLKLYKKVDKARFGINFGLIMFMFILLFCLTFISFFIPENFTILKNIYLILVVVIFLFVTFILSKLTKKIKLSCEIEQDYRINHINHNDVVGHKQINSANGIMEFEVNEKIKKKLKYQNVTSTFGGKFAVGFIIILFLTSIFLPIYLLQIKQKITDSLNLFNENITYVLIVGVFIAFILFTFMAVVCTLRQRIKLEDNTLVDILKTNGEYLIYQYKLGTNKAALSIYYIDLIDLSKVNAFYDKSNKSIFIQGEIDEIYVKNKKEISKVKDKDTFFEFINYVKNGNNKGNNIKNIRIKIYNYFEPNLAEFLGLK